MDMKLALYRYYQGIERGNKSVKLSISILTVWMAVFFLFAKMNNITMFSANNLKFNFDWDQFAFVAVASFIVLMAAFACGFSATDTEYKKDRDLLDNYFLSESESYELISQTVKSLTEITSYKENLINKAVAFNLLACIFAFGSFVVGFFSFSEIIHHMKTWTFFHSLIFALVVIFLIYKINTINKFFSFAVSALKKCLSFSGRK